MRDKIRQSQENIQVMDAEKNRKLSVINDIIGTIELAVSTDDLLSKSCELIRQAYYDPQEIRVRIIYDNKQFLSEGFEETNWLERQTFINPDKTQGAIEVFYSTRYIELVSKDFLFKDPEFLKKIGILISGAISKDSLAHLVQYRHRQIFQQHLIAFYHHRL